MTTSNRQIYSGRCQIGESSPMQGNPDLKRRLRASIVKQRTTWWVACMAGALLALWPDAAMAQWLQRSYDLHAGWNNVFLDVDPSPASADDLFGGLPIDAVWMAAEEPIGGGMPDCPNPSEPPPDCLPPDQSLWQMWLPAWNYGDILTTLRVIRGGKVYLINAAGDVTWTVTGRPTTARNEWHTGFNLEGFFVKDDAGATPTFTSYLAPSSVHANAAIFDLNESQQWQRIDQPAEARITPGEGYWVTASAASDYSGPVQIDDATLRGVDYAVSMSEHEMTLENLSAQPCEVSVSYQASLPPPPVPDGLPSVAGDVPLRWLAYIGQGNDGELFRWEPLDSESWPLDGTGGPGSRKAVRVAVDRRGLGEALLDAEGHGSQYQGLMYVSDCNGFGRYIPMASQRGGDMGLWVGDVTVNQVAWVASSACNGGPNPGAACVSDQDCACDGIPDPDCDGNCLPLTSASVCVGGEREGQLCGEDANCEGSNKTSTDDDGVCTPLPTAPAVPTSSEFNFRIIVHNGPDGPKLLSQVTLMQTPDPEPENTEVNGEYVLVTPAIETVSPGLLATLEPGSMRDGQPFSPRISTAAFGFDGDESLVGTVGTTLTGTLTMTDGLNEQGQPDAAEPNRQLNPFLHRYHPDHDANAAGEAYDVSRKLTLTFSPDPPGGGVIPEYRSTLWMGTYTEEIRGLIHVPRRSDPPPDFDPLAEAPPVNVKGTFTLRRVSGVANLNAAPGR